MISCLTVTQNGRETLLERAVHDFVRQTFIDRELIILHDGDDGFDRFCQTLAAQYSNSAIVVHRVDTGKSLGELRNQSIELASGELICQWDDDDRYHSKRLALQHQCLVENEADFCFLTDQLHYFQASKELFWDNWQHPSKAIRDCYIQGTLLGARDLIGLYPSIEKGEDTPVTYEIFDKGHKVAGLIGHGYLSMYQFTGKNTWDFQHHGQLAAQSRYHLEHLRENISLVIGALNDMQIEEQTITLPHDSGSLTVQRDESGWTELL